jgi:holo-[acyl-carrier protein] synthase
MHEGHVTRESLSHSEQRYQRLRVVVFSEFRAGTFFHVVEGKVESGRRFPMVLGLGTDLIEIERVQQSINRFGERFLERVFTPGEIAYCLQKKRSAESFAARFAAKEAGAKALGTGISRGVSWKEIEVKREAGERPTLHLSGRAAKRAEAMGVKRVQLSLTHSQALAMAVVIVED